MQDSLGAFLADTMTPRAGAALGPLGGASLAVKDIFDVAGFATGCGNRAWAKRQAPAEADAPAVAKLLDAGAEYIGKTVTDEFAYSLSGRNPHYGAPTNVNAPGRVTGGSSSGSAAVVAGGLADIALGSDTGGSVRVPASYCGLYGLRPTHGAVDISGAMPLAPSFDTVGWFAPAAGLLRAVGDALLPETEDEDTAEPRRLLLPGDLMALAVPEAQDALRPWVGRLEHHLGKAEILRLSKDDEELRSWMDAFRFIQAREALEALAPKLAEVEAEVGPEMRERLDFIRAVDDATYERSRALREEVRERLAAVLPRDAVMVLPAAPDVAPRLDAGASDMADHRLRVLSLSCPAGLAGLPQASLPLAQRDGLPLGVSLMMARGRDRGLLAFIERFTQRIEEPDLGARFG